MTEKNQAEFQLIGAIKAECKACTNSPDLNRFFGCKNLCHPVENVIEQFLTMVTHKEFDETLRHLTR